MTQQELSNAAGVDLKTVYNLESGTRWPIAKTRVAVSAALRWEGDALTAIADGRPVPAAPEPPRETPDPGEDAGVSTAVIRAAVPATVREIWTRVRRELAATPSGRGLLTDPAQARAWPAGSAPLEVTPEAVVVLDAMRDVLFTGPVENAAARLVRYTWPERVMVAAASLDVLGQRPTSAVRLVG